MSHVTSQILTVPIIQLPHAKGLPLPAAATPFSAGLDLSAAITDNVTLYPQKRALIPTGIQISLPIGFEGQVRPRSGLALKNGITVLNAPGTIDADYRGEIKVILINHGEEPFVVEHGMRIAQFVIAPVQNITWEQRDSFDDLETTRQQQGFGSTGM